MIDASASPPECRALVGRPAEIVAVARRVLESEGADALTMRRLGAELSIKAPSLYKHVPGKDAIEAALIEQAFLEIGAALRAAIQGLSPADAVGPLLLTYRLHAVQNPNVYRLATVGPLNRAALTDGIEDWAGEPFGLVMGSETMARVLWSTAHGMVSLELDGRYPATADLDQAWAAAIEAFSLTLEKAA